jgi:hypothetical protein
MSSATDSKPKFFIAFPPAAQRGTLVRILQTDTVIIIEPAARVKWPALRRLSCGRRARRATADTGFSCGFRSIRRSR